MYEHNIGLFQLHTNFTAKQYEQRGLVANPITFPSFIQMAKNKKILAK